MTVCALRMARRSEPDHGSAAATDLSGEITQVIGMIVAAAVSSEKYDRHLGDGLIGFKQTESYEALKPVVEALVLATREMESETRALEMQLEESKARAARLQHEVNALRAEILMDSLTSVGNRQYFDDSLISLVGEATRSDKAVSLLFADIDHFKSFNDRFGHQVGDQVLRLVAGLITNALRDGDVVGRYGGEEFGIILPGTPLADAKKTAERIRTAIMARDIKKRGGAGSFGRITISIGVAQFRKGETPVALVERADACLYAAKRAGRNRVVGESDTEFVGPVE